jgi:putative intracellular protease/amidase
VQVTTASVASDGSLTIVCSRGVKLLADAPLVEVADGDYDIIVLPGGIKVNISVRQPRWLKRSASFIFPDALSPPSARRRRPYWCR